MVELWSYRLEDLILFSDQAWYAMLETYHRAWAPLQLLAKLVGVIIFSVILLAPAGMKRLVPVLLAACWAWTAWAFLHRGLAPLHWIADWYAVAFAAQSVILLRLAFTDIDFDIHTGWHSAIAMLLIFMGVFGFPLFNLLEDRSLWQSELFAMTADATVLVTLGVLLLMDRATRWPYTFVPLTWCALSAATAWTLGLMHWWTTAIAAIITIASMVSGSLRVR